MRKKLNQAEKDMLKKVANIWAKNASTVLSNATGRKVKLTGTTVNLISVKDLQKLIKNKKYSSNRDDISIL